ncbi:MAG: hypothetical protein COA79_03485 [Planctomycetota bacterium]|nr:MAG: hypothetical protein COA79_03485 [Planctomycetota bacterium]
MIIAHRGASNLAPENTCASIKKAIELKADGIEIDIHLSKDNHIVVHHDYTTKRLSNKNFIIKDCTLAKLKEFEVGSHIGEEFKNEKIPTLNEILELLPNNIYLFIEIKSDKSILPFLNKELEKFPELKNQIFIIGFSKDVALASKVLMKEIPFYFLYSNKENEINTATLNELINFCKSNNLEGLDLDWKLINQQVSSEISKNDLKLYCWTVNNEIDAENLFKMGVHGITTDKPELFKQNK